MLTIKTNKNYTITVINAYAPTLPVSENDPDIRERFYDELESVVRSVSKRDFLVIAGNFNAKTGQEWNTYPENMGRYGKGQVNSNGRELLEFCNQQDLILTNTLFRHKMANRTTWESPATNIEGRRNPYRNLIDYVMVRKTHRHTVIDSRAHNGLMTNTDHRLVRIQLNIERLHQKTKTYTKPIEIEKIHDPTTKAKFAFNVEMKLMDAEDTKQRENKQITAQDRWNEIVKANTSAAVEVLGYKKSSRRNNEIVQELSKEQKQINSKINATSDPEERKNLRKERNELLTKIHAELTREKTERIEKEIKEIEEVKEDSNKMFKAVKAIQRMKAKTPLVVEEEKGGITTDSERQIEIITEFFTNMFNSKDAEAIEDIPPAKMRREFTEMEVRSAVKQLKNNRSPGMDDLKAEYLKSGSDMTYELIADMLNHIAETGDIPQEMNTGVLIPLQKPGKKRGPPSNPRPVILLSMIRKILAICLIRRIGDKIDNEIPPTQAAYRKGRGTTEQLLALKLMAEKAATTPDYETTILMMDMSKVFDRVQRGRVIEDLKSILHKDELHLIKILIKDVKLMVKIGNDKGKMFDTNIGVPQGDCLSPILFTLYLAKAMSHETQTSIRTSEYEDKHLELVPQLRDHTYSTNLRTGTLIPLQYADDICWLGMNCSHGINNIKQTIPNALNSRNLLINNEKTEEYSVRKQGPDEWKRCKYLGTLLETSEDIKRRKGLASAAMNKIRHITKDRNITTSTKIRAFNAYTTSIFLYNSETWTINKTTEKTLDSYHRRQLRNAINIKWPEKISNIDLYKKTGETPWSTTIAKRRLRLYGHVMRLPHETPIRQVIQEYDRPLKMARGAPKFTWKNNINNDLSKIGFDRFTADEITQDRGGWRKLIRLVDTG